MERSEAPLSSHLAELRDRLKVVFFTLVALIAILLLVPANPTEFIQNLETGTYAPVVSFFIKGVETLIPKNWVILNIHLNEPLEILIMASLILAIAFDMPVIAYEVYKFVDPALKPNERKMIYPFVISTSTLFVAGLLFGYFILAKFLILAMVPFYSAVGVYPPQVDIGDFLGVVFITVAACGVAFTTPVFVFVLIRLHVVKPSFFSRNRLWIWFGVYIVTAVVTPDGGPVLDVALFAPIIVLYELAVFLGGRGIPRESEPRPEPEPKCKYCSATISEDELFCPNCGRAIA